MNATRMVTPRRFTFGRLRATTFVSFAVLLIAWIVVSALAGRDASGQRMVPGPVDIVNATPHFADYWPGWLGVRSTQLGGAVTPEGVILGFLYNTGLTMLHTVGGVILGIVVALVVAVSVSWSRAVRQAVSLPAHIGRLLPLLAMTSLFALWFGDSHLGAILFVGFTSFALVFPIALGAIGGVPGYYSQYAQSLGARGARTYFEVVLPAALPPIRSGVLLAVGFGWSAAIAAEYITAQYGLGHIVKNGEYFGRTGLLGLVAFATLVLAAASLIGAERTMRWATRWAE